MTAATTRGQLTYLWDDEALSRNQGVFLMFIQSAGHVSRVSRVQNLAIFLWLTVARTPRAYRSSQGTFFHRKGASRSSALIDASGILVFVFRVGLRRLENAQGFCLPSLTATSGCASDKKSL